MDWGREWVYPELCETLQDAVAVRRAPEAPKTPERATKAVV